jgi:transcription elongation GreA/GreB family factor
LDKLYFTPKGAERIRQQRVDLLNKLRSIQGQKGEAAEVGGNVWHDNFAFEQLERETTQVNHQIREVNEKISNMVVIRDAPPDTEKLRIGLLAHLDIEGEEKIYLVGGYEDGDLTANPPVVSYNAPLMAGFFLKAAGTERVINIGGKSKKATLTDITRAETSSE